MTDDSETARQRSQTEWKGGNKQDDDDDGRRGRQSAHRMVPTPSDARLPARRPSDR